ncbi:MAG: hypothetical protein R3D70_09385 [Rhizobiaceae bacterium]
MKKRANDENISDRRLHGQGTLPDDRGNRLEILPGRAHEFRCFLLLAGQVRLHGRIRLDVDAEIGRDIVLQQRLQLHDVRQLLLTLLLGLLGLLDRRLILLLRLLSRLLHFRRNLLPRHGWREIRFCGMGTGCMS